MGLETAVCLRGGKKKKSVGASCGQVSSRPSGNVQVAVKEKVDYFNSSGCSSGSVVVMGRRIFPSKDLKINASPPRPPAFYLGDHMQACSYFLFKLQL